MPKPSIKRGVADGVALFQAGGPLNELDDNIGGDIL
jgi:hypothetical protein